MDYTKSNDFKEQLEILPINSEQSIGLIRERARQLVDQLIEFRGHNKPPFLPEQFSRIFNIKKIVKANLGETSAILLRFHDGYVIKVNENHHAVRQNFSCAHEIGHILFSELKLERYIHNIEYREFNPSKTVEVRARARERLCDVAASELLMPESVFKKYLSGFGVSINSVERLAEVFKVSIRTAAWRIAEVSEEPCLVLIWQPWPRNKSKGLRLAWRVGPGRQTNGAAHCMPVNTLVKSNSTLYKAYQFDNFVRTSKLFKIDTISKKLPIEAKGFGRGETRYVVSLAFLNR